MSDYIANFRKKYPEYDGIDDNQLTSALHKKYQSENNTELSLEDFNSAIGYVPPAPVEEPSLIDKGKALFEGDEPQVDAMTGDSLKTQEPDTILQATSKAIKNVPERFQQSAAGILQLAGEDLGQAKERHIAISAERAGISANDYKLLAWAGKQGLIDPKMQIPEALEYVKLNVTGALDEQQLQQLSASGLINPDEITGFANYWREQAQESMDPVNVEQGSPAYYTSAVIGSLAEMIPALSASILTRNPTTAMKIMAGQVGGGQYAEAREEGASIDDAQMYALASAAAEAIPEYLPLDVILKPGKNYFAKILKGAAAEGLQETVTESINIGLDMGILDKDMTWQEARTRLTDAGIIGTGAGGGMGAVVSSVDAGTQAVKKVIDSPERQIRKQLEGSVESTDFDQAVEAEAIKSLTPEQQLEIIKAKPPEQKTMAELVIEKTAEIKKSQPETIQVEGEYTQQVGDILADQTVDLTPQADGTVIDYGTKKETEIKTDTSEAAKPVARKIQPDAETVPVEIYETPKGGLRAVQGDKVLGEIESQEGGTETVIDVAESARGQGVGKKLMKEWIKKNPFVPSGGFTEAGQANWLSALRELKEETKNPSPELQRAFDMTEEEYLKEVNAEGKKASPDDYIKREVEDFELPEGSKPVVSKKETKPDPEKPQKATIKGKQVVEAPIDEITLSEDVPQFKEGAGKAGVVEELGGKFERTGVAPIQIWVREDGAKEVISGRHRLDLAKRSGEETIPAQYHYESEGFDQVQAASLDAILNIREGQGKVKDYVEFIKATTPTEKEAAAQGILARSTGKRAFTIATQGEDSLLASHRADVLTDEAAVRIALAAPNNDTLQAVGIKASQDGKTIAVAENLVKAVGSMTSKEQQSGDLFGFDDSAMIEAERLAKAAAKQQAKIQKTLTAIQGAAKNPELAKKEGVNVKDPAQVKRKIEKLKEQKREWQNWHTNPTLVAELKGDSFDLSQETEEQRQQREQEEATATSKASDERKTAEQKAQADKDKDDFVLEGSDSVADKAAARGQDTLFSAKPGAKPKQDKVSKDAEVFNAPGANYLESYSSMGLPERQEVVTVNGKTVRMPEAPQRIDPIMNKLISIMGPRIYNGKIKGKSSAGFYRPKVGEMRTRKKNDVEVLAHEMAHYLDFYSTENKSFPNFAKLYQTEVFKEEVSGLSYTDDKKLELIEGFAEYVRLWLTNSQEAAARAPKFTKAFELILKTDKKLQKQMRDLQVMMHKFYFQGADKLGQALIGGNLDFESKFNQWKYRRDSRIRQQTIDRFHAARKMEQELTGKIGTVQESAWKQMRIAAGGAEGISDYILNYGTLNFDEKGDLQKTGKSLKEVFDPVKTIKKKDKHKKDEKIDLLMRYFAGRRALELHRQGRENLIPKQTAREWAKLGADYPIFESIQKEFQEFNGRMMDMYEASGMVTPEGREIMQSMNKDYVPFFRVRENLAGGTGAGSKIQKLKGGTSNLNDILVNIQDGVVANVQAALKNRAKVRLYQYVANSQDGAIWASKLAPDSRPVQVYKEDMQKKIGKVLEASGINIEGELSIDDPSILTFFQNGVKPTLNESGNMVDTVMINGKPRYFEVQDPLLQDMLLGMNPESYSTFMNIMFGVKNMFTRSITLGVEFTMANLVRDTIGATFLSKNNFKPFIDSFIGMHSYFRKDKYYRDFMRSGGGFSGRLHGSTREGRARRRVSLNEFGVMTPVEKLLTAFDNFMSAFEYGTRLGEFRLAQKKSKADMDAGFGGREISTDFSAIGANHFLTGYIRTIPFLNAMIQSQDRVYREALVGKKYDGNPTAFVMKAVLGITIPSLILYMLNKDDEDYQEIPEYEKRTNWHVKTDSGRFIKIPKPYDVGFIFATIPELFYKYVEDQEGKELADGLMWTMTQMYGIDGTPAVMTGWWDIVKNEKWTGAPVVPQGLADVSAPNQYNSNTSETFVRFGEATGLSPIKAEHMFKAYTGYLGGYLMAITDRALWDEKKFGERMESDVSQNIFLKRFLTPRVRPSTANMEKFFDLKEKSDQITADFKQTIDIRRAIKKKTGDGKFKDDTFFGLSGEEKAVLFALNDSMNDIIKLLYGKQGIKTAELKIVHDKELTGKQKREELDKLWATKSKIFTTYYTKAKEALDKAKAEAKKREQTK